MKTHITSEPRLIYLKGSPAESGKSNSKEPINGQSNSKEEIKRATSKKLRDLEEIPGPKPQHDEFTVEDLSDKEKETYNKLPNLYKEQYLDFVRIERLKEQKEEDRVVTIEYGSLTYVEIKLEFERLLPIVLRRTHDIAYMLDNIYEEKDIVVPEHVWEQTDAIFDNVPDSEKFKKWNREVVKLGHYAHMAAYLLQDFRNSEEAGILQKYYTQLNRTGRIQLEEAIQSAVGNPRTYEFVFKSGYKPSIFPPTLDPKNKVIIRLVDGKEWYTRVRNEDGEAIYQGIDVSHPTNMKWESNFIHIYDKDGNPILGGHYYKNNQPNFKFFQYDKDGSETGSDFFKTYLGLKGKEFWYEISILNAEEEIASHVVRIPLNDKQVVALKKFFRWERGEGD